MSDSDDDSFSVPNLRVFSKKGKNAECFDTWFKLFTIRCNGCGVPQEPLDADGNFLREPNQRRCTFLLSLDMDAVESLRGACYPDKADELPIPVLAEKMRKMFSPSDPVICRFEFNNRFQREDENGPDYVRALLKLAQHCQFGDFYQEALRDRLICGLRDPELRCRILFKKDVTFDEAWRMVRQDQEIKEYFESTRGCSNCGRKHDKGKCPAQQWKCRKCKQFGHGTQYCQS